MTDVAIKDVFNQVEEEEGKDRSTVYLMQMTADRLGLDYMEVVDAMVGTPEEERIYDT